MKTFLTFPLTVLVLSACVSVPQKEQAPFGPAAGPWVAPDMSIVRFERIEAPPKTTINEVIPDATTDVRIARDDH